LTSRFGRATSLTGCARTSPTSTSTGSPRRTSRCSSSRCAGATGPRGSSARSRRARRRCATSSATSPGCSPTPSARAGRRATRPAPWTSRRPRRPRRSGGSTRRKSTPSPPPPPARTSDRAMYVTAAMTELRQGELVALLFRDIDWTAGATASAASARTPCCSPTPSRAGTRPLRRSCAGCARRSRPPGSTRRTASTTCGTRSAPGWRPTACRCGRCRSGWGTPASRPRSGMPTTRLGTTSSSLCRTRSRDP
jgi:hypothetical protein